MSCHQLLKQVVDLVEQTYPAFQYLGENGATIDDVLVHDMYNQSPGLHLNLSKMLPPEFPVALGVIRSAVSDTYCEMLQDSIDEQKEKNPIKCVDDLLNSGDTWVI